MKTKEEVQDMLKEEAKLNGTRNEKNNLYAINRNQGKKKN